MRKKHSAVEPGHPGLRATLQCAAIRDKIVTKLSQLGSTDIERNARRDFRKQIIKSSRPLSPFLTLSFNNVTSGTKLLEQKRRLAVSLRLHCGGSSSTLKKIDFNPYFEDAVQKN